MYGYGRPSGALLMPKAASHLSGVLVGLDEKLHKADMELLDRYLLFSSEILRLSLAAFAGIGLVTGWIIKEGRLELGSYREAFIISMLLAMVLLAGAAAFAMCHRYLASDGMYHHLRAIKHLALLETRGPSSNKAEILACVSADELYRNGRFHRSAQYLFAASLCLTLGVVSAGAGFGAVMLGSWNLPASSKSSGSG